MARVNSRPSKPTSPVAEPHLTAHQAGATPSGFAPVLFSADAEQRRTRPVISRPERPPISGPCNMDTAV
jgi:hypothetical protein